MRMSRYPRHSSLFNACRSRFFYSQMCRFFFIFRRAFVDAVFICERVLLFFAAWIIWIQFICQLLLAVGVRRMQHKLGFCFFSLYLQLYFYPSLSISFSRSDFTSPVAMAVRGANILWQLHMALPFFSRLILRLQNILQTWCSCSRLSYDTERNLQFESIIFALSSIRSFFSHSFFQICHYQKYTHTHTT